MDKWMNRRKWLWLGMWILSIVGISYHGGAVSYGFFFALTLMPVISFLYLLCVFFRFKIYQEIESRDMVCGQAMPYFFILRNEDYFGFASVNVRMYPNFSHVENVAEDMEYELLPGDEFTYHTRITCKYRGEYEVGVKDVIVTDFFRLFRLRYRVVGVLKAIVKPKLVEVEEISALQEITSFMPREALLAQQEPDVVVRDYMQGDSLKRIHWKAAARTGQLKVRKDIGEEKQGITVFFDTERHYREMEKYLPLESKMLEVLLALGIFFAKRDMAFSVFYQQREIRSTMVNNIRGFEEFYAKMSEVAFSDERSAPVLLQELYDAGSLRNSKAVIGVVHGMNDALLQLSEKISAEGNNVVLYVVSDEDLESFVRQSTSRRKIIVIPTEAELEGVL